MNALPQIAHVESKWYGSLVVMLAVDKENEHRMIPVGGNGFLRWINERSALAPPWLLADDFTDHQEWGSIMLSLGGN